MKLQQQLPDAMREHLVEMIGIGALVLFGVVMVFFGWLKFRDRNNPKRTHPEPKSRRKRKRRQ